MILQRPRITEKSTRLSSAARGQQGPAYTFVVSPSANKASVKRAFKERFGLLPLKVNIIRLPAKRFTYRGRPGRKSALKKALVYLKAGDKIEFV